MSLSIEPGPEPAPTASIVVFMDPGPDPDDVKTILILARLHNLEQINVKGFVCSGGKIPVKRALLTKLVLNKIGVNVPVFCGSKTPQEPNAKLIKGQHLQVYKSHAEYELDLEGFAWNAASDEDALFQEAKKYNVHPWDQTAWREIFKKTYGPSADLIVQIQGPFTDAALCLEDVLLNDALRNPTVISCQGGAILKDSRLNVVEDDLAVTVDKDGTERIAKDDLSFNNALDVTASQKVVNLAIDMKVTLHMFHKSYVPHIDTSIAGGYANNYSHSTVMRYLAKAQTSGLVNLWNSIVYNDKNKRPGPSPQWFFDRFCIGKTLPDDWRTIDIDKYKSEQVTPYDVCALLTVLPGWKDDLKLLAPDQSPHGNANVTIWKMTHSGIKNKEHNVTNDDERRKLAAKAAIKIKIEDLLKSTFAWAAKNEGRVQNLRRQRLMSP